MDETERLGSSETTLPGERIMVLIKSFNEVTAHCAHSLSPYGTHTSTWHRLPSV